MPRSFLLTAIFLLVMQGLHAQRIFRAIDPVSGDTVQTSRWYHISPDIPTFRDSRVFDVSFWINQRRGLTRLWLRCYSPDDARKDFYILPTDTIYFILENGDEVAVASDYCAEQERSPFGNLLTFPLVITKTIAARLGASPTVRMRIQHNAGFLEFPLRKRMRSSIMENIQLFKF